MTQDRKDVQPAPTETGAAYWRSLEQLAGGDEIDRLVANEFEGYDAKLMTGAGGVSRRQFMRLAAASMALAGLTLTGCRRWPRAIIAPFSAAPKGTMPGEPQYFASVAELGGIGRGTVVQGVDGRPIKVEGNPLHPMFVTPNPNIGATDFYQYGSTLNLYDPDRSRSPVRITRQGDNQAPALTPLTWDGVAAAMTSANVLDGRVAVLSEAVSGPTAADMRRRLTERVPNLRWFTWEAVHRDNEITGLEQAFGQRVRPMLKLDTAAVVVSFDADLLREHPANIRYQSDWARRRQSVDDGGAGKGEMNRVFIVESTFTVTGTTADYRLPAKPQEIATLVRALAARLGAADGFDGTVPAGPLAELLEVLAAELTAAGAQGVVAVGPHLPADCHAAAAAINAKLGAIGTSVVYTAETQAPVLPQIAELTAALNAGEIDTLLILGGNPVYNAPADLQFPAALAKAPLSVHLSEYFDETSAACTYHLPKAHWLESWGDAAGWDGTLSVRQPLILPLFGGKTAEELIALLLGEADIDSLQLVRRAWQEILPAAEGPVDGPWRRVLHDGLLADSAAQPVAVNVTGNVQLASSAASAGEGYTVTIRPCPKVYDGRFANNGWLQENPHPLTMATWDNVAALSKHDADQLGVKNNDVLSFSVGGRTCSSVVYILPGQPHGVVGLTMGYGRRGGGRLGINIGFDVFPLTSVDAFNVLQNVRVEKTGETHRLALTQHHHLIDAVGQSAVRKRVGERFAPGAIIREASLEDYRKHRTAPHAGNHSLMTLQLYDAPFKTDPKRPGGPENFNDPHAWGMAIDMNLCTGCNNCVIACTSENNLPIVGKEQVIMGREMQWIRIDRYFKGDVDNPDVVNQPLLCVHCENAPCEQVCPVAATVHDTEGLNTMVYNRCIGTRYCANNCPYKVRRFNYFDYHSKDPHGHYMPWLGMPDSQQKHSVDPVKAMVYNPEVTVRMRGVMEKCTYCTQRIKAATIQRKNEWSQGLRDVQTIDDGDVITACQQACPTQAIVFGNLNDPNARVTQKQALPRTYDLLGDLNTRPRGKHMARIRNRDVETTQRLLGDGSGKEHV